MNTDKPASLNELLQKVDCSNLQIAAVDAVLARVEAHVMNLCLAAKGLQSLAAGGVLDAPAQAMQVVGWDLLNEICAQRESIREAVSHCTLTAPSSELMN